ncbi:hypothetical protein [Lacrimispora defluvii]|uniref:TPM domain-containing protein n=1 Tax=Lacrimispora defluvii TaxID=2719233 RepID=A0ABX1VK17_9FIRM|nr:hypothetical protein [Lacrimispora defluvii]NNJ28496.1 hypothetical protein [Lacrimispora defluvii]
MMKRGKFFLAVAAAFLVSGSVCACSAQESSELLEGKKVISQMQSKLPLQEGFTETSQATAQPGFDSPESAVEGYLTGFRESNLRYMTETFSENREIDDIMRQYAILCGLGLDEGEPVSLKNAAEVNAFADNLESGIKAVDFKSVKLVGFVDPGDLDDAYTNEKHQENLIRIAKRYGGDKMVSCVAAIEVDGRKFFLIFDVIRKDGRWFNHQLGGIFANMSGMERKEVGTLSLETADEQILKQLVPDFSKNLLEAEAGHGALGSADINEETGGFDTSQMAVSRYLEYLAANEQDKMIGTFAVESYVDHFDFRTRLESSGAYIFMQQEFNFPAVTDFTRELNIESRKNDIRLNLLEQYTALGVFSEIDTADLVQTEDLNVSSALSELPKRLNLSSIKALGYISPEKMSETYGASEFQDIRLRRMKAYGADDIESIAAVFELNGARYIICIDTVKYKDSWYIRELGGELSLLLGIDSRYAGIIRTEFLENPDIDSLILPLS